VIELLKSKIYADRSEIVIISLYVPSESVVFFYFIGLKEKATIYCEKIGYINLP